MRGSGDEQAAARVRKRPSPEDDLRVVVRRESLVDRVRLHVEAATRAIEETTHREQPILRAISDEIERRMSTEDDLIMWTSQPVNAEPFLGKEDPQRLVDTEYS